MVKLLRNGMHHPRGEMHFSRGRGFPRFPIQPPHLMVQQMPSGNHDHFPHSVPPYLPPSSRGRLFPGPVPPPQYAHNPHCPVPPPGMGPFMPRGEPQISRGGPHIFPNHRSFPPKPIPPQHPISPGPHRGDLIYLGQEQRIFSNHNSGQSFIKKPDSVKRLGVVNGKRKQKRKSKPKERSEEAEINKPWMTEKLKTEISKKHKLYHEAKEKNTEENWAKYTEQRTLVGKISNAVKLEYIGTHPDVDIDKIMFGGRAKIFSK